MRLIDADAMNEKLFYKQLGGKDTLITAECAFNMIKAQPTAYDVDKVVAELEEETECPNCSMYCADAHICGFDEMRKQAIEIVKQGGVSDDVCEWRLCDEEANVYDTSCRNPHILIEGTPKENNYEYCPYCGKKIKVVE